MKKKKIYPFIILTVLIMSFIVMYDINEGKIQNFAYADSLDLLSTEYAAPEENISLIKYDIITTSVEHETKIVNNEQQFEGYEKIVQSGKDGITKSFYQMIFVNGKIISKNLEEKITYVESVDEIIEVGTKKHLVTSRGGMRFSNEIEMKATAYDLSYESTGKNPGDLYYGITASGTQARPGVVAVDPRVIPLGTKLYVASTDGSPDYGFATAEDTGGAIKGNRIDLFMTDNQDAYNFGIRKVKVYILK